MPTIEHQEAQDRHRWGKAAKAASTLVIALLVLASAWATCGKQEQQVEPKQPPKQSDPPQSVAAPLELGVRLPVAAQVTSAPNSVVEFTATLRVMDPSGSPIQGASLQVAMIPQLAEASYPFHELPRSDDQGRSSFGFTATTARNGLVPDTEQLLQDEEARAAGYRQVRDAPTPIDSDQCVLVAKASAPRWRSSSAVFRLSIRELLTGTGAWSGDIVLAPVPRAPILTLRVIDKETKLPISDAIVRHSPTNPRDGKWVVGRSDHNGMVRELLGCGVDFFAQVNPERAYLDSFVSVDGFPLTYDRLGVQFRVSVVHFPEYAPGFCEFAIMPTEEAFKPGDDQAQEYKLSPDTGEITRVIELAPRKYFELQMLDFDTGQPIDDDYMVANASFLYRPTGLPPIFRVPESYTSQSYPVKSGTIRVALDQSDLTGLLIKIGPKDNQRDGRRSDYIPHFIPGANLPAPDSRLSVTFSRQPSFTVLIKELDAEGANPRIFVRSTVSLVHKQVTHHLGHPEPWVWEREDRETPERRKILSSRFPVGAIDFFAGWEGTDLESWELQAIKINHAEFTGYEVLGPDMQVLAPWSDSATRGTFVAPLALFQAGTTQVGEPDGTLVFYVRREH